MPITQPMYEDRERFMLDVLQLTSGLEALVDDAGDPELQDALRAVERVYSALNGRGVEPGTLYPPTLSQRQIVDAAQEAFERAGQEAGIR